MHVILQRIYNIPQHVMQLIDLINIIYKYPSFGHKSGLLQ